MLVSTRFHIPVTGSDAARAVLIWLLTCATVFYVVDGIATRDVPVHVEQFRRLNRSDEQVISLAVQAAYAVEENAWWINSKRPYLVFEQGRSYRVAPELYDIFSLEIVEDAYRRPIALLREPQVASVASP